MTVQIHSAMYERENVCGTTTNECINSGHKKKSRSATLFVWIKRNLFADEIKLQEPDGKREIGGKRKHWLRKWRKKEKKRGKKRKE